ncbi:MAG: hypothetical protein OJF47_000271 [Nitrospira sp.]|nr:MAG: hypothetical protein OJF47_000271 [Nitrospira sp.]
MTRTCEASIRLIGFHSFTSEIIPRSFSGGHGACETKDLAGPLQQPITATLSWRV